ncbi:hypothetical protein RUM43_009403 [Polyplax serrata]|uniref:Uncharacterized protein n=1 Tax=Polyplax serrata TaxID=468196 RepID=A0AAN8S158_POLSC
MRFKQNKHLQKRLIFSRKTVQLQIGLAQHFPRFCFDLLSPRGLDFLLQHLLPSQHLGLLHLQVRHLNGFEQHVERDEFAGSLALPPRHEVQQQRQQKRQPKNRHKAEMNLRNLLCWGALAGTSPFGILQKRTKGEESLFSKSFHLRVKEGEREREEEEEKVK